MGMAFYSNLALSWGMTGHRVVGEIATFHLTKKAQKNISKILINESLAEVSNWMDDIRSDKTRDSLKPWHYVTIPDGETYDSSEKNPKGDVIAAIEQLKKEISKGNLDANTEAEYLKILVHLIGDIHQPLHVGRADDRGGNTIKVEWFWESSNLHRVWDSGMIDSKNYSFTELAILLNRKIDKTKKTEWQSTTTVEWAHEAMTFRKQIYDLPEDKKINYEYRYNHWDLLKIQLLKAGIRLAGVLNGLYG